MPTRFDRRRFIQSSVLGAAGIVILKNSRSARAYQANDKLRIAVVGACGQGGSNAGTVGELREAHI